MLPTDLMKFTVFDLENEQWLTIKTYDIKCLRDGTVFINKYAEGMNGDINSEWYIQKSNNEYHLYSTTLSKKVSIYKGIDPSSFFEAKYIGDLSFSKV